MQHVRRPVWRPVWRPGLFTHEPVMSHTGQTITAGCGNAGRGFGTLSVYVVELSKNYTRIVSFFSVSVNWRVFGMFWQNFEWIQGVLTCVLLVEKKRCEMTHVVDRCRCFVWRFLDRFCTPAVCVWVCKSSVAWIVTFSVSWSAHKSYKCRSSDMCSLIAGCLLLSWHGHSFAERGGGSESFLKHWEMAWSDRSG